ncbi:MAG TPA: AAA family ATPase [Pirellulales bacterium]|nr:AAA family ATPase [Pirellulales bacterium]
MSHDYDDDDPSQAPVIPSACLKLDEIKGETQTKWLWPGKVPVGHVTIVAGEASSGKSLLAAEIAARVSSGAGWPRNGTQCVPHRAENDTESVPYGDDAGEQSGTERPGAVLIAHANQHENRVLKGRLLAAGADPSRVSVINRDAFDFEGRIGADEAGDDRPTLAEESLTVLEGAVFELRDASLVVIDHLLGWLGRSRLRPDELTEVFKCLADMAARYRVALVVLWRLEKGGRAAQTRALDALAGVAPVVWLMANDTYSSPSRSAVCAQNRLSAQSENLAFRVAGDRLVWQEVVRQVSADDVLASHTADRHERRQAGQWLWDVLSQGPIEAKQLLEDARQSGLAERTLRRAAAELGFRPMKDGKRNVWIWGARVESGDVRPRAGGGTGDFDRLPDKETRVQGDKETRGQGDKEMSYEAKTPVRATVQNVAVLPLVGSLANADGAAQDASAGEQNVAVLPAVGNLADSAVVRVDLRPDSPPSVAALPPVGSLAEAGAALPEVPASEQNVAVLPSVGSLADADAEAQNVAVGESSVGEVMGGGAEPDEVEQKLLAQAVAAAAVDGGNDKTEQSAPSSVAERRLRRAPLSEQCESAATAKIIRRGRY